MTTVIVALSGNSVRSSEMLPRYIAFMRYVPALMPFSGSVMLCVCTPGLSCITYMEPAATAAPSDVISCRNMGMAAGEFTFTV